VGSGELGELDELDGPGALGARGRGLGSGARDELGFGARDELGPPAASAPGQSAWKPLVKWPRGEKVPRTAQPGPWSEHVSGTIHDLISGRKPRRRGQVAPRSSRGAFRLQRAAPMPALVRSGPGP